MNLYLVVDSESEHYVLARSYDHAALIWGAHVKVDDDVIPMPSQINLIALHEDVLCEQTETEKAGECD